MTVAVFRGLVLGLLAAVSAPALDVGAQTRGGRPGDRQSLEREIRERFGMIVKRELGLDDETERALAGVLSEFDERRRDIARRKRAIQVRLGGRASLDPSRSGSPLLSTEEATRILEEIRAVRADENAIVEEEEAVLLSVLTGPQLVRFVAIREAFAERTRRLIRNRGGGGRATGPGGPGPLLDG